MPTLTTLHPPAVTVSSCGLDLAQPASAAELLAAVQAAPARLMRPRTDPEVA